MHKLPLIVAGLIFALMAIAHIVRLFYGYPLILGTTLVPVWVSGLAIAISVLLAYWMFSSACCCRTCERK